MSLADEFPDIPPWVFNIRMTEQEKRAQRFSFAIGNVLCMNRYRDHTPAQIDEVEWDLRIALAKFEAERGPLKI